MRSLKYLMSGLLLALLVSCGGGGGCASSAGCSAQDVSAPPSSAIAVSIGFDGTLASADNDIRYAKTFAVSVTDQDGLPVAGADVTPTVSIPFYIKGFVNRVGTTTVTASVIEQVFCPNEDVNLNDILDTGEDINGDGEISPRQALVSVTPAKATTDGNGVAFFQVRYFKSHAIWMQYRFSAQAKVSTTEGVASLNQRTSFIVGDDVALTAPPFARSPWGVGLLCTDTL